MRSAHSYPSTALCVLMLLFCLLLAHPFAEAGLGDDVSYVWSAHLFANTGHILYSGFSASMLGWQMLLGAVFIKLFGFSFTAVRASVMLLSLVCCAITHRLFLRLGFGTWNASLATLGIVLSPVALPLESTFFNDVPGDFAVLTCMYLSLRALQARTARATVLWLCAAASAGVALGTTRQISFLAALLLVPAAAICVRQRRGALRTGALLWVASLVSVLLLVRWFNHQPYSLPEPLFSRAHLQPALLLVQLAILTLLLALPILAAFAAPRTPLRAGHAHAAALAGMAVGCVAVFLIPGGQLNGTLRLVFPMTAQVPLWLRLAFAGFASACVASLVYLLWRRRAGHGELPQPQAAFAAPLSGRTLLLWLGPFSAGWLVLLVTRISLWPRYLLPLLPGLFLWLLWTYTNGRLATRLPAVCAAVVAVFAALGVAVTHDDFALVRAQHAAELQYLAAGQPRTALEGGFALDAWVQLNQVGYINDWQIRRPAGAFHPQPPSRRPAACRGWFLDRSPVIHPHYQLTDGPSPCYAGAALPPVPYRTWLPPAARAVYTSEIPANQRDAP